MNLDHIRTFLEVAACGNFNQAAEVLNVSQSTASARIKALEDRFGHPLFERSHAGAVLTAAGRRFHEYAVNIQQFWQQAHHAVTLPEGYRAIFKIGAQMSLWDRLIVQWLPWMRGMAPDIALRAEADYSPSQMRMLTDGLLDLGVMYQPRQTPGLAIEELLQEVLVLVSTKPREVHAGWVEDYVFVDWGDTFRTMHGEAYPEMRTPAVSVGLGVIGLSYILQNGGSGYFPLRVVRPLIEEGRLHRLEDAQIARRPVYMVYSAHPKDADLLDLALTGLRHVASLEEEDEA